jgi:hypothetical protein
MKPNKNVDKDTGYMREAHGTACLITEVGKADRLLELAHKRRVNRERMIPIDSWDI